MAVCVLLFNRTHELIETARRVVREEELSALRQQAFADVRAEEFPRLKKEAEECVRQSMYAKLKAEATADAQAAWQQESDTAVARMRQDAQRQHDTALAKHLAAVEADLDDRVTRSTRERADVLAQRWGDRVEDTKERAAHWQARAEVAEAALLDVMQALFPQIGRPYAPGRFLQLSTFPLAAVQQVLAQSGAQVQVETISGQTEFAVTCQAADGEQLTHRFMFTPGPGSSTQR
jgi:hypothetical protein